jgi:hypothetical protein
MQIRFRENSAFRVYAASCFPIGIILAADKRRLEFSLELQAIEVGCRVRKIATVDPDTDVVFSRVFKYESTFLTATSNLSQFSYTARFYLK